MRVDTSTSTGTDILTACSGRSGPGSPVQPCVRKYRRLGKLPSDMRRPHRWRTRPDPFADVWGEVQAKLEVMPGEALDRH